MSADIGRGTDYGFEWGPLTVERVAIFERSNGPYRILRLSAGAACQELQIYVSPTGRSVRVFRAGRELT